MAVQPKLPAGGGVSYKGEVEGTTKGAKYAHPFEEIDGGIPGLDGTHNDIGEKSGFQADTSHYIVKKGMAFGEAAKLNIMPPGMDIGDQPYADIRDMPMRTLVAESYPGDGWEPAPTFDASKHYPTKGSLK